MKSELYLKHKKELKFNPDNFYCNSDYGDKDICPGYVIVGCYGCNNVKMRTRKNDKSERL